MRDRNSLGADAVEIHAAALHFGHRHPAGHRIGERKRRARRKARIANIDRCDRVRAARKRRGRVRRVPQSD